MSKVFKSNGILYLRLVFYHIEEEKYNWYLYKVALIFLTKVPVNFPGRSI